MSNYESLIYEELNGATPRGKYEDLKSLQKDAKRNIMTAFESYDRMSSLELTRSFIQSILELARKSGNELQIEEFNAKLDAVNKEIETLIAQA